MPQKDIGWMALMVNGVMWLHMNWVIAEKTVAFTALCNVRTQTGNQSFPSALNGGMVNIAVAITFSKRPVSLVVCSEKWVRHSKFKQTGNRFWITASPLWTVRANWKWMQFFLPLSSLFLLTVTKVAVYSFSFCKSPALPINGHWNERFVTFVLTEGLRPSVNTLTVPNSMSFSGSKHASIRRFPIFFHSQWLLLQHNTLPFKAGSIYTQIQ